MTEITAHNIEQAGAPFYLWWAMRPGLSLADEIKWAAERWREKYGRPANTVLVHPSKAPEGGYIIIEGCQVRGRAGVQLGTLWCGWEARA